MIKVKGQISEMAICLEDKEEKIAGAAKLLFSELAQKVGINDYFFVFIDFAHIIREKR